MKNIDDQIKQVHEIVVVLRAKILHSDGDFSSLK